MLSAQVTLHPDPNYCTLTLEFNLTRDVTPSGIDLWWQNHIRGLLGPNAWLVAALATAAGIDKADVVVERFLHRMVVAHASPRPGAGLAGRPPVGVGAAPGLFVAGDWVGPIGMLSDASFASGEAAAAAAVGAATMRARV